jgi:membrane-associated protein
VIEQFLSIMTFAGEWFYLILFLAIFLECAAFIGLIIPGEASIILAGFLSSRGYVTLEYCLLAAFLGSVLGDNTGFLIGKKVGSEYFNTHNRLILLRVRHIKKTEHFFSRHEKSAIFFGKFVGIVRPVLPFFAGISKVSFTRFFIYDFAAGIIWSAACLLLGYFFGRGDARAGIFDNPASPDNI